MSNGHRTRYELRVARDSNQPLKLSPMASAPLPLSLALPHMPTWLHAALFHHHPTILYGKKAQLFLPIMAACGSAGLHLAAWTEAGASKTVLL